MSATPGLHPDLDPFGDDALTDEELVELLADDGADALYKPYDVALAAGELTAPDTVEDALRLSAQAATLAALKAEHHGLVAVMADQLAWDIERTEHGVAQRFNLYEGVRWRFAVDGTPFRWAGTHWAQADLFTLKRAVYGVLTMIEVVEAGHIVPAIPGNDDSMKAAAAQRKAMRGWARSMRRDSIVKMIIATIPTVNPKLIVQDNHWDADGHLVNTPRGVFNLRTGGVLPHDPAFLMTMITAGDGHVTSITPDLQTVLDGYAKSDPGLPEFFRRLAGAGISGYTGRTFAHLYGHPGTGKSTLIAALVHALGGVGPESYAAFGSMKVFEAQPNRAGDSPDPTLSAMRSKRMCFVDEAANKKIDADLVKSLAGGNAMSVRGLHATPRVMQSKLTLIFAGNGTLRLPDDDLGIVDRFLPPRLTAASRPDRPDAELDERLRSTQANRNALVWWAIGGAIDWIKDGRNQAALKAPESVLAERISYLRELDPIEAWWEETIRIEDRPAGQDPSRTGASPTIEELIRSLTDFRKSHGYTAPISRTVLTTRLENRGFPVSARTKRNRQIAGFKAETLQARFVDGIRLTRPQRDDTDF